MRTEMKQHSRPCRLSLVAPTRFPFGLESIPVVILHPTQIWLTYVATPHASSQFSNAVVVAEHKGNLMHTTARDSRSRHFASLFGTYAKRFLAQHVLVAAYRGECVSSMIRVPSNNGYRVDVVALAQLVHVAMNAWNAEQIGQSTRTLLATANCNNLGVRMRLEARNVAYLCKRASADDGATQLLRVHSRGCKRLRSVPVGSASESPSNEEGLQECDATVNLAIGSRDHREIRNPCPVLLYTCPSSLDSKPAHATIKGPAQ